MLEALCWNTTNVARLDIVMNGHVFLFRIIFFRNTDLSVLKLERLTHDPFVLHSSWPVESKVNDAKSSRTSDAKSSRTSEQRSSLNWSFHDSAQEAWNKWTSLTSLDGQEFAQSYIFCMAWSWKPATRVDQPSGIAKNDHMDIDHKGKVEECKVDDSKLATDIQSYHTMSFFNEWINGQQRWSFPISYNYTPIRTFRNHPSCNVIGRFNLSAHHIVRLFFDQDQKPAQDQKSVAQERKPVAEDQKPVARDQRVYPPARIYVSKRIDSGNKIFADMWCATSLSDTDKKNSNSKQTIWSTIAAPDPLYVVTIQSDNCFVATALLQVLKLVYHTGHMHGVWSWLVQHEATRVLSPSRSLTFPAVTRNDLSIEITPIRTSAFVDYKGVASLQTSGMVMFSYMCQTMLHDIRYVARRILGRTLCHEQSQIQLLQEDSMHHTHCNQRNVWAYHYPADTNTSHCVVCIHPTGFRHIWSNLTQQHDEAQKRLTWEKLSHALLHNIIHEVAHCVMVHGHRNDAIVSHGPEWSEFQASITYAALQLGIGLSDFHQRTLSQAAQFASEETCQKWFKAWSRVDVQTIV
jgi:hypothetical protein